MAVHPENDLLITGGQDGQIVVWNIKDGQALRTIDLGRGWVENVRWSPSSRYRSLVRWFSITQNGKKFGGLKITVAQ